MANLYKRGDIYYFYICSQGRRIRKSTGTSSKNLALKIMRDVEAKITLGKFDIEKREIGFNEFWSKIAAYSQTNHSPKTVQRYRAIVAHFRLFLEKYPKINRLSLITADVIEQYKSHRRNCETNPNGMPGKTKHTKIGANTATVNYEISVLRLIFNLAIEWGYLLKNPAKGIKRLRETDKKEPRFLSIDECRRLLEACEGDLRDIFYTFLNTGMRRGELENLQWNDVDFARRRLVIRYKPSWQPKSGERELPINEGLLTLLKRRKAARKRLKRSDYVFPNKTGGKSGIDLRKALVRTAQKAEIPDLTRVHDLRHTFASQLIMKGVDITTVQKLLGHASIETTMIYSHLADSHIDKALEKIDLDLPQ